MSIEPSIKANNSFIGGLSHFKNPQAVLPTLLIEACCTSGRTYQSYKRGGNLEAKERFREEAISGIFWLWGVKGLNKIGDFVGEKIFKLKDLATDVGKDSLRDPSYLLDNKTRVFKFSKIILSVILATGLIGFGVPKINHAITARTLKKRQESDKTQNPQSANLDTFVGDTKIQKDSKYLSKTQDSLAFGALANFGDFISKATYNLENNNTWRLISTDTGMIAGRIKNSRHPAEALEYGFRDTSSIYFYNFAAANMIMLLNKMCKTPDVHPKALASISQYLGQALKDKNLTPGEFLNQTIKAPSNKLLESIKLDSDDTIKVRDLLKQFDELGINRQKDRSLMKKTLQMAHLQPKLRGERILSKQQLEDVFSENIMSDPKFLKNAINDATYGRACDARKFVSRKTTEGIRSSIDEFCQWCAKEAAKKGKNIDAAYIASLTKKSVGRTAIFQVLGMAFSAFGLAILIPKLQIFLSQKVFGKKTFEDIATGKEYKNVSSKV